MVWALWDIGSECSERRDQLGDFCEQGNTLRSSSALRGRSSCPRIPLLSHQQRAVPRPAAHAQSRLVRVVLRTSSRTVSFRRRRAHDRHYRGTQRRLQSRPRSHDLTQFPECVCRVCARICAPVPQSIWFPWFRVGSNPGPAAILAPVLLSVRLCPLIRAV